MTLFDPAANLSWSTAPD